MEHMMSEEDTLLNLQQIDSLSLEDIAEHKRNAEQSGSIHALREMFAFAKQEQPEEAGEYLFAA